MLTLSRSIARPATCCQQRCTAHRALAGPQLRCTRVSVVRAAVDGYGGAQGDGAVFVTSSRRTRRRRKDPNDAIEALREALGLSSTEFNFSGTAIKQLQYTLPLEAAQKVAELLSIFPAEKNKRHVINLVKRYPRVLDIEVEDAVQKIDAIAAMLGLTRARALAVVAHEPQLVRYRTATLQGKINGIVAFAGAPLEYVQRAICNRPRILALRLARLQERLQVAREAAAAVPRWTGAMEAPSHGVLTAVLGYPPARQRRLKYLIETGTPPAFRSMLAVLNCTPAKFEERHPAYLAWAEQDAARRQQGGGSPGQGGGSPGQGGGSPGQGGVLKARAAAQAGGSSSAPTHGRVRAGEQKKGQGQAGAGVQDSGRVRRQRKAQVGSVGDGGVAR